jgi:hypothetical protein
VSISSRKKTQRSSCGKKRRESICETPKHEVPL